MDVVGVSIVGPRADVVLKRPEVLNAVNLEVFDGLAAAADEVAASDAKVVVVSGEGRSFCSGIDVSAIGAVTGAPPEMIARAQAGYRKLAALPMPTLAVVQGHALGAGLQLALACDVRIVASDARLGLLEANYGLIPDLGGSTRLPQIVGSGRAKKMIWLAEQIDGTEAERLGIAELAVPPGQLQERADAVAGRLAEGPTTVMREAKALADRAHLLDVAAGMDAEAEAQARCMSAPDFGEAMMKGIQRMTRRDQKPV
ncbi:MAG TPA: enoyl-CoA hydratase/isomerase family protein [Actinomycetota bacterium]|nr:enoyl-CoA hydratase/isomerase family protein [Actinomycetota bacterium]